MTISPLVFLEKGEGLVQMQRRYYCSFIARTLWLIILLVVPLEATNGKDAGKKTKPSTRHFVHTPSCKRYEPASCALAHNDGPASVPYCHHGDGVARDCSFNTSLLKECPLPAKGKFKQTEAGKGGLCEHPFMRLRLPAAAVCGPACCTSDLPGGFSNAKRRRFRQSLLAFQPHDGSCYYHQYSWRGAMDCLTGTRLVFAGDSIMRQLFNAGVSLFRGQVTSIDYNKHAHGRYRVCESEDRLEFSSFEPERWEIPLQEIKQVFHQGGRGGAPCGNERAVFELDFLWAPKYTDLTPNLVEYHAEIAPSSPVSYVVFAGFWEDQQTVPEGFLEALDTIRDRAKSVVIIGVPRVRLFGWKKDNAAVRNNSTRAWAESRSPQKGGNVFFLDFDHLATAHNAPEALGSLNWHYQCFLDHGHLEEVTEEVGGLGGAWHWPQKPSHLYPSVWTDDGARCKDEMDANIWQILLNLLCNRRARS